MFHPNLKLLCCCCRCQDGITVSAWIRTETDTPDETYFLSTGTYALYYRDGALHAEVMSPTRDWHAQTRRFNPTNAWQKVRHCFVIIWSDQPFVAVVKIIFRCARKNFGTTFKYASTPMSRGHINESDCSF